jgi:hypothetical protein
MSDVALRCQFNGAPQEIFVVEGFVRERQRGPAVAYLECSSKTAPPEGSPATVVFHRESGPDDTFVGTVRRAKAYAGNEKLVVSWVGGAGKLITPLRPVDHVLGHAEVPAGLIARAIVADAGEQLAAGVEAALNTRTLPRWHRATDVTAATALDLLADELGYVWRILRDGTVWIGAETWAANNGSAYLMDPDLDDGAVMYAVRGAPLIVGQAIDGVRAIETRYNIASSSITAEVRSAVSGDPPFAPDRDLYRGSYSATVVKQNTDGTLDVRCDDGRIGDLRALALRVGIPGALVTVPDGARVRVRFDGASPKGAFAEGLDQDSTAVAALALVGDGVNCGTLALVSLFGLPAFQYTPPGGVPGAPATTVTLSGSVSGPGHKYVKGVSGP